jgi:hypothetical protein
MVQSARRLPHGQPVAKVAHPDAGGTHEVMTALVRARDDALAAITSR